MLHFLPGSVIGCISVILYIANTILWLIPILICSLLKASVPLSLWQKFFSYLLDQLASNWVLCNTFIQKVFTKTKINVTGLEKLKMKDWYLVISNHQSWIDILVLQRVLHGKIPFLKFFLKRELIYVPLLGLAWWALDFPFMKRYSQHFLKKNPHLIGKDIDTTKKACEKFKHKPVSVMNFIEGTRFTAEKHQQQNSPFQRLLKPKAGGIGFVLQAMKGNLSKVVNVTIYYPDGTPKFFDFLSGKIKQVNIAIETQDIDESLKGDYVNDRAYKIQFQQWVNQLWLDKDKKILQLEAQAKKDM
jgi:1-acyl-sn-glycerol-3-phosphate acyltransferase